MKKVVFISGFIGGPWDDLEFRLSRDFKFLYFGYDTSLQEPISYVARRLDNFIKKLKLKKNEKIGIVAHSAGGIIAEYYLKYLNHKKVDKFVAMCTPFFGTFWAYLFFKIKLGLWQIRTNSRLLKKLNKKKFSKVKVKTIWCEFDPFVPLTSGKGKNPEHTCFFLHWGVQYWPPIVMKVEKFLRE